MSVPNPSRSFEGLGAVPGSGRSLSGSADYSALVDVVLLGGAFVQGGCSSRCEFESCGVLAADRAAGHHQGKSMVMKPPSRDDFHEFTVAEYLNSTQTSTVDPPLPVHSTLGVNFLKIIRSGRIQATKCTVFKGEKLSYLFIGRPSYKKPGPNTQVLNWMLPVVFILRGLKDLPIKRIFPLDTGALATNRLPEYLSVFDRDMFFLGADPAQIGRIIASFYETADRYMSGESLSISEIRRQVHIDIRHAAIQALIALHGERSLPELDDRGRNIEVQVAADIPLDGNVIGVVAPDAYRREGQTEAHFNAMGAVVEFYNVHPMNASSHFGQVYDAVDKIMKAHSP